MYSSALFQYEQKGNGVILIWNKKFLFAVGKEAYWDKTTSLWTITYTNIGGHVESRESMLEATKREVMEEIGCSVEFLSSDITLFCYLEDPKLANYKLEDKIAPILVYNSSRMKMSVSVYLGYVQTEPFPKQEVPAILLLPSSLLSGGHVNELEKSGALLKEQIKGIIPRSAILKPFGSAEVLANNFDKFIASKKFNDWYTQKLKGK